ncbi:MAG: hypothetical protein COC23_01720 [Hyphomicrobiales bacterium]|nr:MAG: hypothetical protein COC23_01720 [Hyphomicrobiales bacterium]
MAGFEDLIRGALIKQDSTTKEGREKVYYSARQALTRMTTKNGSLAPDVIESQHQKLELAIVEIEASYADQLGAPQVTSGSAPDIETPVAVDPATVRIESAPVPDVRSATPAPGMETSLASKRQEPGFGTPDTKLHPEPSVRLEPIQTDQPSSYSGDVLREKKPYAKMLLWTIILVGIGVAIWWAITFGPGLLREQFDGSVPNPATTQESGSFVPGGDSEEWSTVFLPSSNAENIVTNGSGAAELLRDGAVQVMRLASPDGTVGNNLLVKVPRGVMQDLRGKAVTFELTVKAVESDSQEFVVFCEFSQMGNCGRKRFTTSTNKEAFIFDVLVNDAELAAGEDAYLSINTDFNGKGRALDLFSVRVRSSQ